MNMNLLSSFMNLLPIQNQTMGEDQDSNSIFLIHARFNIENKIIVAGSVTKGNIKKKQVLYIGPDNRGDFRKVEIVSIHCYKLPVYIVNCGQSCSVEIRYIGVDSDWLQKTNIKKGMVMIDNTKGQPKATYEFRAKLCSLDKQVDTVTIPPFYEPTITSFTLRQTCVLVEDIESSYITSSSRCNNISSLSPSNNHTHISQQRKKQRMMSTHDDLYHTLELMRHRSKSSDYSDIIPRIDTNIKEKRKKGNQTCMIDQLLAENNLKVSKPLINHTTLSYNKNNIIRLRFKYNPEYLQVGYKILINDDKLKCIGVVTDIFTL